MKVAFDSSFLAVLFNPNTHVSVGRAADRLEGLLESLSAKKAKVIIPTPVLTEILIKLPKTGLTYVEKMRSYGCFQVRPFDERAAVELAAVLGSKAGKQGVPPKSAASASKIKFDRQIVAVAKVHGATIIYSDDGQVCSFAKQCGLQAKSFADISVPMKQQPLNLQPQIGPTQ